MNSGSKEIIRSLVCSDSTYDIWKELKDRFQHSNGQLIYQLHKEFVTIMQETMHVEAYYTKLKTIWKELNEYRPSNTCTCDGLNRVLEHFILDGAQRFIC